MVDLLRMFQEGGWAMYGILLFGLPALGLATTHALSARKWSLIGSAIALVFVLVLGIGGMMLGRSRVDEALNNVAINAENAARMRAQGYSESNRPIQFAGIVAALGGLFFAVGEIRRRKTAR
jgi:fumarate reductase subunit D